MEQAIINPMWIYWIEVAEKLRGVIAAVIGLSGFILLALLIVIALVYDDYYGEEKESCKKSLKKLWKFICVWLVFLMISLFIPSKTTLISMLVAKTVTVEKVVQGKEAVKDSIDYIFEKINETKENK